MAEEKRPFTFTSLNENPYLEFTIKRYEDHHGITDKMHQLMPGDELIISDVWGAIEYKGPGYFIAGGAGITPFISILRQLHVE
ncbi:MAG: flavodoxin reductase, partial [Ginsengibacter sp.]